MKKGILYPLLLMLVFAAACSEESSADDSASTKETENIEETEAVTDSDDQEQTDGESEGETEEAASENTATAVEDQGEMNVWLKGDITISDGNVSVNGSTNLLPESELYFLQEAYTGGIIGGTNKGKVEADGSFHLETRLPEDFDRPLRLKIRFRPADQFDDAITEHYSETGDNLEGGFVRKYDEGDEVFKNISYFAHVEDPMENQTLTIEPPNFEEPASYGEMEVQLDAEVVEKTEHFVIVEGTSNLLEGTNIEGLAKIPDFITTGFVDNARVQPDGSFRLYVPNPETHEDMKGEFSEYQIRLNVTHDSQWATFYDTYGKNGENFTGPLAVEDSEGKKLEMFLEEKVE